MSTKIHNSARPAGGVSLAVLVPTRNRAGLAIAAVRSLLEQSGCRFEVLVSDNSSSAEERRLLADFCRAARDPRLTYVRPPGSLAMGEHWDWALRQALARPHVTHVALHYDRKITKPGRLGPLAEAGARHPDSVITYPVDIVVNEPPPAVLYQPPWTGRIYRVATARLIELTSLGRVNDMGQAFPFMSNCLVPRRVLEGIRGRFGNICNSTGPDSCFTYRFCSLDESYLHLDMTLGIVYASHRSNGNAYLRGKTDGDFGDFLKTWGDRPWLDAAPIPGLNLGQNMLFHEYVLARRAGGDALPPIDMGGYLRHLGKSLAWVEDARLRDAMRAVLEEHGWREEPAPVPAAPADATAAAQARGPRRPLYKRLTPRRVAASARARLSNRWAQLTRRQDFVLFLADYLRIKPPHVHGFTFGSDEEAVRYALLCPRGPEPENPYIQALEPAEVDSPLAGQSPVP